MLEEFFDAISLYSLSLKIKSRRLRKMITWSENVLSQYLVLLHNAVNYSTVSLSHDEIIIHSYILKKLISYFSN